MRHACLSPLSALAALFAAWPAHGAVILREVDYFFHVVADPEFQSRSIDFDANGVDDIEFFTSLGVVRVGAPFGNRVTSHPEGGLDLGAIADVVPPGVLIGASLPDPLMWWNDVEFDATLSLCGNGICIGRFGEIFLGVEFAIDDDLHYGWVRLDSYAGGGNITRLAYQSDPGGPILVPIPEPGAGVLVMMASVVAWRRRRLHNHAKLSVTSSPTPGQDTRNSRTSRSSQRLGPPGFDLVAPAPTSYSPAMPAATPGMRELERSAKYISYENPSLACHCVDAGRSCACQGRCRS
jgi:hypothetical protein